MSLQGNLTDLPLTDLLQIFSVQNKKGVLAIKHQQYQGQIYFEAASLRAAFIYLEEASERRLYCQGEEAIYTVMDWSEGIFTFEMNNLPEITRNIFVNWSYLVLEQCRRQDERERQQRTIQVASQIPHLVANPPIKSQINLNLEEWRILLQVNSIHSVSTIAATTREPLEEIINVLENLEQKGLIELNNISKFPPKAQPVYQESYLPRDNQIVYYSRAVGAPDAPPIRVNPPLYGNARPEISSRQEPKLAQTTVSTAPPTFAKPKVQRGILSSIMAKIKGL